MYVGIQVISSLDSGVDYYVRVSARNNLGYGATQSSSPTYQHPYEEPTAPTDVVLGVTSDTMLTVSFYLDVSSIDLRTHMDCRTLF